MAKKKAKVLKKVSPKVTGKYFTKTTFIPGFGLIPLGTEVSKEILTAWDKVTKVDISNRLTDKAPE